MPLGGSPHCPRCKKPVYFAEEISVKGQKWHKQCVTCRTCNKGLDSFTITENQDEIYCKGCHGKQFGPQGYGYAGGAAGLSSGTAQHSGYTSAMNPGASGSSNGGATKGGCPKCGKAVYFAEEKIAMGKKWHKMCFKCGNCNRLLDSSTAAEHDGDAFCKACYGKLFGPKGYGFGGGAAGLSANSSSAYGRDNDKPSNAYAAAQGAAVNPASKQSRFGVGPICPRCTKTVYFAEEVVALGEKWHKLCLRCNYKPPCTIVASCDKSLQSGSLQEHGQKPYCKVCYGKLFGPKGYGFGGGGAGLSANRSGDGETDQPSKAYAQSQVPQAASVVRGGAQNICPRCSKPVYFAEEVIGVGQKWHKRCFACSLCNATLSSTTVADHDGDVFCKSCHGKNFGPKGYGFAGGASGLSTE